MLKYTGDIIERLKAAGYTSYRIRQEKIIGQSLLQKLRTGDLPSMHELDILCDLLNCQPGDIIRHE